jgi:hypothetical protein
MSQTATSTNKSKSAPPAKSPIEAKQPTPIQPPESARPAAPKSKISEEEKKQLLAEYIILPADKWPTLAPGQHIRYIRADTGAFVRGGYILCFVDLPDKSRSVTLANSFDREKVGRAVWTVPFKNIKTIYLRQSTAKSAQAAAAKK